MTNAKSLIRVEITDEPLATFPARPKKDGSGMTAPRSKQKAYLHQGNAYPTPFEISVAGEASPYKPGMYLLGGQVFSPGEWNSLKFNDRELDLVPVSDALAELGRAKPKLAAAS